MSDPGIIDVLTTTNYHHIDNGGIYFKLKSNIVGENDVPDENFHDTKLEINACYFGYPSLMATIDLEDLEHLKSIIDSFTEHYRKLKAKGME